MADLSESQAPSSNVRRYACLLGAAWTLTVFGLLAFVLITKRIETLKMARTHARAAFERDVLYRRWNAMHGGVYVPVTDATPPNPYLDVPEREITTPSGQLLTKVNPAYMTRQVHELGREESGIQGHITSLNPIRPENAADPWETEALLRIERGENEASSIETMDGVSYMRLMSPLVTDKTCLECHAAQGYQEGDIRGGISMSIPMAPLWAIARAQIAILAAVHILLWIFGLGAIAAGAKRIARNLSDLREKEGSLRESEQKFRSLYESTSDAVMLLDEHGFFDCNGATLEIFHCANREEFCDKHPAGLSPPTQPDGTDSMTLANERIATAFKKGSNRFEWTHRRADGEDFPADVLLNVLKLEGKNVLQAVVRDITERKEAEKEQRKLNLAIEQSPVAIVVTDTNGIIEYVNPAFTRISGYTQEEAIGKNSRVLKSSEQSDEFYAGLWRTIRSGEVWHGEIHNKKKNGELYWESASISPVQDENGVVTHFIAVMEDITERKRAEIAIKEAKEAAEAAAQAKAEFLANMSHEIRTPMNGVIGMTGLLLDTELDSEQRQFAETIRNSADSLLTVINDILDFSKIEAGKMDLEVLDFDLRTALDEMNDALAMKAQDKRVEYVCLVDPEVPSFLQGDPGRIRQILTNIIGNAIKFTAQGEVKVHVLLEEENGDHVTLRFAVSDTGIGIPEDRLNTLFEAFTQADASTTRKYGGTGLGLSIGKQLAELMGGEIGAESEEGKGATFWFTAVFEKQSEGSHVEFESPENIRGKRVLVVDDNETNRLVVKQQLLSWGCRHDEAPDGKTALEKLKAALTGGDPFDIAILDMQMPEMDGETLGRKIMADPALRGIPLVMMSSIGQRGDAARLKEIGFSVYLTKPVKQSQLYDCLASVLGRAKKHETSRAKPLVTKHSIAEDKRRKVRILLAEDNITNQVVALAMLKKLGYRADAVANGEEAVKSLEFVPYDLVLMDCQMPVLDGYEATALIRAPQSTVRNHHIPIIAMTAHAMTGDREKCLAAGMNDYVSKPVNPQELADALERQLQGIPQFSGPAAPPREETAKEKTREQADTRYHQPAFDKSILLERFEGDEEAVTAVFKVFIADAPKQIQLLKKALEAKDARAVRRQAHSLKGAAGNVGAPVLERLALQAENAGNAGDLGIAAKAVRAMDQAFEELKTALASQTAVEANT